MANWLLKKIVDGFCWYGKWGAGVPSCHGAFEVKVPEELIRLIDEQGVESIEQQDLDICSCGPSDITDATEGGEGRPLFLWSSSVATFMIFL